MRVIIVLAIVLAIMSLPGAPPVAALFDVGFMGGPVSLGTPYVIGPGFSFITPFAQGGYIINEARTSTLASDFTNSFALSFLPDASNGPTIISPIIAQTSSQTIAASESYFFNDFLTGV
jgi:hypothetical protein